MLNVIQIVYFPLVTLQVGIMSWMISKTHTSTTMKATRGKLLPRLSIISSWKEVLLLKHRTSTTMPTDHSRMSCKQRQKKGHKYQLIEQIYYIFDLRVRVIEYFKQRIYYSCMQETKTIGRLNQRSKVKPCLPSVDTSPSEPQTACNFSCQHSYLATAVTHHK